MNVCFISNGGCNVRQLQSERLKVGFAGETTFHTAVFKKNKKKQVLSISMGVKHLSSVK